MATKTFTSANKKWSEESAWSPAGVPAATDDVIFNSESGTCTVGSTAAKCRSINCEGYKKEMTFTTGKIAVGTSTAAPSNIAIKLSSEMTLGAAAVFSLAGTTTEVEKISLAGRTLKELSIVAGASSKWRLEEELKVGTLVLTKGGLETNGQTVTVSEKAETSGAATRALSLGASTVKLTGQNIVAWNFAEVTGLTFAAGTSTIQITDTEAQFEKVFEGGGLTYATLTISGDLVKIQGSNTFTALNVNTARARVQTAKATLSGTTLTKTEGANIIIGQEVRGTAIPTGTIISEVKSATEYTMSASATEVVGTPENVEVFASGLLLKEGTTQTVTTLTTNGKASELARLSAFKESATYQPAAAAKIKAAGTISTDYMIILWSKAETGEFYAGANGEDRGNNTGWKFEAAPAAGLVNAQSMVI